MAKNPRHPVKGSIFFALIPLGMLLFTLGPATAQEQSGPAGIERFTEHRIKAAFIFNFLKFIELPGLSEVAASPKLLFCLTGAEDFSGFESALNGKKIGPASIETVKLALGQSIDSCNVVFISYRESNSAELLQQLRHRRVLTVGETPAFLSEGGIIRFVVVDNKIRFEISNKQAEAVGIRIRADLLKLALKVEM